MFQIFIPVFFSRGHIRPIKEMNKISNSMALYKLIYNKCERYYMRDLQYLGDYLDLGPGQRTIIEIIDFRYDHAKFSCSMEWHAVGEPTVIFPDIGSLCLQIVEKKHINI